MHGLKAYSTSASFCVHFLQGSPAAGGGGGGGGGGGAPWLTNDEGGRFFGTAAAPPPSLSTRHLFPPSSRFMSVSSLRARRLETGFSDTDSDAMSSEAMSSMRSRGLSFSLSRPRSFSRSRRCCVRAGGSWCCGFRVSPRAPPWRVGDSPRSRFFIKSRSHSSFGRTSERVTGRTPLGVIFFEKLKN